MTDITYTVYKTSREISDIVEILKANRLYVNGWMLRTIYIKHVNDIKNVVVAWKYQNNTDMIPIAVGIILGPYNDYNGEPTIMIFVKPSYRRTGIGTTIYNKLKKLNPKLKLSTEYGIKGSDMFYNNLGL